MEIDIERLRALLNYDRATGVFTWRVKCRGGRARPGKAAGYIGNHGYIKISIGGRYWLAHRLAWAHVHGVLVSQLDHINRNKADNRIANLRPCTAVENNQNSDRVSRRPASALGTTFRARSGKWQAQAGAGGRNIYLGCFDSQSEAHAAYLNFLTDRNARLSTPCRPDHQAA
jgi:hypothetical protein